MAGEACGRPQEGQIVVSFRQSARCLVVDAPSASWRSVVAVKTLTLPALAQKVPRIADGLKSPDS